MKIKSPIERLANTNPDMELWWDSSPLVYSQWIQEMLSKAPECRRAQLREQLSCLYNANDPSKSIFRGCTTNPLLSLQAIQNDPHFWNPWIDQLFRDNPDITNPEASWITYKEIVRRGGEMYMKIFESSDCRYGWISGQLDPRQSMETNAMIEAAQELSNLAANIMVKVPATMQGIEALKTLTSKAISTNVTVCFTLSQILAAAKAVWEGTQIALQKDTDLTKWRSVITMMVGRLTEREEFAVQAERRGINLTRMDKHWSGVAIFKRALRILHDNGWPSKMLACSLRAGPVVAGKMRFWDIQLLAGGDFIFTMPPYVLEPLLDMGNDITFRPNAIAEKIPANILGKLLKIPYFIQAYDPNGMALEQFNNHPATVYTINAFSKASEGLEQYVRERGEEAHNVV